MFLIADRPAFFPHTTLLGSTGGPVVDTRIDMPVGGRVYVDEIEAKEIARHFGFMAPADVQRLQGALAKAQADLNLAKAKLRRVGVTVDEIVAA